jgi:DUF4097 and DUF4098 domain-containing protein YvlB
MRLGLTRWSVLAVALTAAVAAHAAELVVAAGANADTGSRSVRVPAGVAVGVIDTGSGDVIVETGAVTRNIDTGSGSVELSPGASSGRIDTGSGSVRMGADAQARVIDTGSGSIRLASGARTEAIDTGSGSIRGADRVLIDGDIDTGSGAVELGSGSTVRGNIDTGSGSVELTGVIVEGKIDTGSGDITLIDCQLRDDLVSTRGEVKLEGSTHVGGDLIIRKSKCWGFCWGENEPTRVVVGAGASVAGEIRSERETELWVHQSARIGKVSGAEVKRFSGERP